MTADCKRISDNTGYTLSEIERIKRFIFIDEHDLGEEGIKRFDPSFEMAQSWQRLIDGKNIQKHDLTLLKHEVYENGLIDNGMTQDKAHRLTSLKYNYEKESGEYYDSIKRNKKRK